MTLRSFLELFTNSDNSFEGQEESEKVILILRKHIFIIYSQVFLYGVLIFVPWAVGQGFGGFLSAQALMHLFVFISSLWMLFFWAAIFYSLTMYSLNVVIITDHRIIESSQLGLFKRKISELHLSRVQDISVRTDGIIETALKFGDLEVQTASEQREFIFRLIPNPEHVKDVIMNLVVDNHL
ncbi:MAG: hypothetical protein JWN89_5 [Parcubacteria group bacterium]|nr:hypothetical protein [Parcubacteria group bacterium]